MAVSQPKKYPRMRIVLAKGRFWGVWGQEGFEMLSEKSALVHDDDADPMSSLADKQ